MQSGKVAGDPAIGRYLADTLALVPHLARPDFERLFNDSVQVGCDVGGLGTRVRGRSDGFWARGRGGRSASLRTRFRWVGPAALPWHLSGCPMIARRVSEQVTGPGVPSESFPPQDSMMVTYLSDLLRTHVALAERLGTAALPIM